MKIILLFIVFKFVVLTLFQESANHVTEEKQILGHFHMIVRIRRIFYLEILNYYLNNIIQDFKKNIECLFNVRIARNIINSLDFPITRDISRDLIIDLLMEYSDFFDKKYKLNNFPDSVEPLRETTCLKIKTALNKIEKYISADHDVILNVLIKIKNENRIEQINEILKKNISLEKIKYQCFFLTTAFYTEKTRFISYVIRNYSVEFTEPFKNSNISNKNINKIEYSYVSYLLLEFSQNLDKLKINFNLLFLKKLDNDLINMKLFLEKLLQKNKEILFLAQDKPFEKLKEHLMEDFKSSKSYQEAFLSYLKDSLDELYHEIIELKNSFCKFITYIVEESKNQSDEKLKKFLLDFKKDFNFIIFFFNNEIITLDSLLLYFNSNIKNKLYNKDQYLSKSEKKIFKECVNEVSNIIYKTESTLSTIINCWEAFISEGISILITNHNDIKIKSN